MKVAPSLRVLRSENCLESRLVPATFLVTTAQDLGPGSLRQAVLEANALPGADVIEFDPTLAGQSIRLSSEIAISESEQLTVDGSGRVTISGDSDGDGTRDTRIFFVSATGGEVVLTGLMIERGGGQAQTNSGFGGAIFNQGRLTLDRCLLQHNSTWFQGGAIYNDLGATLTVQESTLAHNTLQGFGSAVSNNGTANLVSSAIVRNVSLNCAVGNWNSLGIINSTISGNAGVGVNDSGKALTIIGSTIADNSSRNAGGVALSSASSASMRSSIVIGNSRDITGALNVADSWSNVIGDSAFAGGLVHGQNGNSVGVAGFGAMPSEAVILPLSDNGGLTETHGLAPNSPAINFGVNVLGYPHDQRGPGFPRSLAGITDVGSFESDPADAIAQQVPGAVISTPGGPQFQVSVAYTGSTALDASLFSTDDITVEGLPAGTLAPIGWTVDVPGNGSPRVVTYTFDTPAGAWSPFDNGRHPIRLRPGATADVNGRPVFGDVVGYLRIELPGVFVVDSVDLAIDFDFGPGRLTFPEAMYLADRTPSVTDTITFAPSLSGAILRPTGQWWLNTPIVIDGANRVTFSGDRDGNGTPDVRLFYVPRGGWAELTRLTLSHGGVGTPYSTKTAAILNEGQLRVTECVIRDGRGGLHNYQGELTVVRSQIVNNSKLSDGGGIYNENGIAVVESTWIHGNKAGRGGGIASLASTAGHASLTVRDSTLTANSSGSLGSAIHGSSTWELRTGTVAIINSTISANLGSHGSVYSFGPNAFLSMEHVTVANNGVIGVAVGKNQINNSLIVGHSRDIDFGVTAVGARNLVGTSAYSGKLQHGVNGNIVGNAGVGTLPVADVLLPLSDYGGPTPSHALAGLSPAIDAGTGSITLTTDQRGPGFARFVGVSTDIGAFERQAVRRIVGITINDGAVQRSRVASLEVRFDQPPEIPADPGNAFRLVRQSDGAIVKLIGEVIGASVRLTFGSGPLEFGSLADGRYTLTALADAIPSLDGNADGTPGDDYTLVGGPGNGLFRLFGDINGDGLVSSPDFLAFRLSFLHSVPEFDFDQDGIVHFSDYLQFRQRFLKGI